MKIVLAALTTSACISASNAYGVEDNLYISSKELQAIDVALKEFRGKFPQPLHCYNVIINHLSSDIEVIFMPVYVEDVRPDGVVSLLKTGCNKGATYIISESFQLKRWNAHR